MKGEKGVSCIKKKSRAAVRGPWPGWRKEERKIHDRAWQFESQIENHQEEKVDNPTSEPIFLSTKQRLTEHASPWERARAKERAMRGNLNRRRRTTKGCWAYHGRETQKSSP